jgi:type I site-specific restriction endonuclease
MPPTEAFSRALIDAQLAEAGWKVTDGVSIRFEETLSDGKRADYVLCDRHGRALAVVEAKRTSRNAADAAEQAAHYARVLDVPFVFLANGREVRCWEWQQEVDKRIAGRDYQHACIDTLCQEIGLGRRKLLVEMATGTGKTRTAAALIKRLFEANARHPRAVPGGSHPARKQTEDAFAEHLPELPRLCAARRSPLPGREAHHHHHAAKHGEHLPRLFLGLLRPGHHRRMPPQHLRQVERRAQALRRHPDWPDRHAVRGRTM